jgi:Flp pilus assembly protein TadD
VIPSRYIDADKMQQQMDGFREYGQRSVMQFLRQPWDLTFYFPTSNSFLGSVFLFLGPGLIFLAVGWRRGPPVRNFFLLTVLLSLLIWSSQTQITRYLIPALGLLAILCALAMEKMEHLHAVAGRWVRWVALLLVVIHSGLLAGIVMGNFDPMGYALGLETRSVYLQKHLLTDYEPMAEIVNQLAGPVKVMLVGEGRAYYFHKPVVSATVYNASPFITLLDQSTSAEQAWQGLRREGYTHLLIAYQEAARTRGYERYLWTEASLGRLQELYARYLKPVKDNGTLALYEIVQTPQTGQPVKKGRPLFTYAPDAVAKANSHMYQGYQALQQGQEMQAMAEWQRCLELAPEWEIPYLQLGWLYLKVGRPEDALQMFRQADGLASLDPSTYNNLGALEMQKGRPEEAKRCFQLALQGDPNLGKARENLEQLERTKAGR